MFKNLKNLGMPKGESEREKVERLTQQVQYQILKAYDNKKIMDEIEKAIIMMVGIHEYFDCSRDGIGKRLFGFEDHENPILGLHIGVLPGINSGCLNVFAQKISNIIYENGDKDLIVDIIVSLITNEMKKRFAKNSDFVFEGTSDSKNQGIIKRR